MTADVGRKLAAGAEAARQYALLRIGASARFMAKPKPGHRRGIDFYSAPELVRVMGRMFYSFRKKHGSYPNLVRPVRYNEKILWHKLFAELPVPEAGNKSLTSRFIPADRSDVKPMPIVFRSTEAVLPPNDALEPGWYFVKANHGSDMLKHVHFPLAEDERKALESTCAAWLTFEYGRAEGEWWYCAFPKEILIERAITANEPAVTWCFAVVAGVIIRISIVRKVEGETLITRLDPSFNLSAEQNPIRRPVSSYDDFGMRHQMTEIALALSKPFGICRVDLYVTPDREIYLGEMTFAPGNGLTIMSEKLDLELGQMVRSYP